MRAVRAPELDGVLGGIGAVQAGMVAIGLGMAMAARAVDDGPAAALALAGALFGLLGFAWTQALWAVVAASVGHGAGTLALARLGGLGLRMRFTALGAGIGGLAATALPPGVGFFAVWLLFQAAATLPRGGGADWWVLGAGAAAALAGAAGLLGFAVLRVLGIAFLGRPRSPRGAVAEEAAPGWRWLLLGLGGAVAACGLVPGAVVWLAGPALRLLTGTMPPAGVLRMAPGMGLEGISPLGIAALLALATGLVWAAVRARSPAGHRVAPAWEEGAGPAPSWLPFGDPATQAGPRGMAAGLAAGRLRLLPPLAVRRRLRWPSGMVLPRLANWEAAAPGGLALLLLAAWLLGLW
jgi:hydrogenase-4 component B